MTGEPNTAGARSWREIVVVFLRLGATAYGGPAIIGTLQAELQEQRHWVSKERFLEGLSLVNLVPGATATQLAMFLGHARAGWRGGVLAGLCFIAPAFCIMLVLASTYAALGAAPIMRAGLYGLGPVVLASFVVAVYRLGRAALAGWIQLVLCCIAAGAVAFSTLDAAAVLALAIGTGVFLFHSRRTGALLMVIVAGLLAIARYWSWTPGPGDGSTALPTGVLELSSVFLSIGSFTFGGGITMLALTQEQVVNQLHWLSQQEFIDGLALGQLTPGPVLMVAAYVGYKVGGLAGAMAAASTVFLPSFVIMLVSLPLLERIRALAWTRAAMKALGSAVIGVMAVSLIQLAPAALPDAVAVVVFLLAVLALLAWRVGVVKLMGLGASLGVVRKAVAL